ncbi:hypothetical protein GF386_02260 [Candidatus Pacearchaeota archaeon]|nr:hypothetical protein [Candidatus Pacearchaeota archaeon]
MVEHKNLLLTLSVIILLVSLINISVTLFKISDFKKSYSGYTTGYVNITVLESVVLEVTRDIIDWGSGQINDSYPNATLYTSGNDTGVVERGNWSGENAKGIIVKNIGSVNCSLYIKTDKDAHDFFESFSSSNEEYKINVSDKESGSCYNPFFNISLWYDVNKTSPGDLFCEELSYYESNNEVFVDVLLTVPNDTTKLGVQSDLITFTGTAA